MKRSSCLMEVPRGLFFPQNPATLTAGYQSRRVLTVFQSNDLGAAPEFALLACKGLHTSGAYNHSLSREMPSWKRRPSTPFQLGRNFSGESKRKRKKGTRGSEEQQEDRGPCSTTVLFVIVSTR